MSNPREVLFIITDAGGGHRSAANAIAAAAAEVGAPWRPRIVSLQDVLAPLDLFRRFTGLSTEELYNGMVRRHWTFFLVPMLRGLHWLIDRLHRRFVDLLAAYLTREPAALVVSLMPNFNGVIRDAVREALPGTPFWIVLTDYADFPPHFWIEPGVDGVVVGSEHAVNQALATDIPRQRIARTTGMILNPRFYAAGNGHGRAEVRRELNVPEDALLLMLLYGGKGSAEVAPLAGALIRERPDWHVVAICGDNPRLQQRTEAIAAGAGGRLHVLGFTRRVAELMAASDLLLTKPGPGSLAEAFHARVPVVVTCNGRTVPQERHNARLVQDLGLGLVVSHWRRMPGAAAELAADPDRVAALRTRLAALPGNRAVYEVVDVLTGLVDHPA